MEHNGIDTRSLSDRVYDYLSNQIIRGQIRYGDRLRLKEIAQQLNVSTMPIRDALKRLQMEDVVEMKPRSTCYVKLPTKKSVLDAIEMRKIIEEAALGKLLNRTPPPDLSTMRDLVDQMDDALHGGDDESNIRRYIDLDRRFHMELCRLSENEQLQKFYREVNLHLNMHYRYGIGRQFDLEVTLDDHREIVELLALQSREALSVLDRHLKRSRSNITAGREFQSLPE